MAGIQRRLRKDGTEAFRVNWWADGKVNWSPTLTSAEGAAKLKDMIERIGPEAALAILNARTTTPDARVPLLHEYLDTHLERAAAHATPGTVADYRRMAARTWLPRLGDYPLDAITRDHVTAWVAWQRKQETDRSRRARAAAKRRGDTPPEPRTYTPKSIANAQRFLSTVLAAAVEDGHITKNPAKGVKLPSDHEHAERVYLTADEFTAIYAHIRPHYQPLVATLYGTGMRWGEATALRVGDVDLEAGVITVRQAWKKGDGSPYLGSAKSKRGHRTITITGGLLRLLRELLDGRPASALVFTSVQGKQVRSQNFHPRIWRPAVEASGIGKRPDVHSLRHSHASNLIRARVPLPVIQRRLGHESITTTIDTYGHLAPDSYAEAAEAADLSLVGALPQIEG